MRFGRLWPIAPPFANMEHHRGNHQNCRVGCVAGWALMWTSTPVHSALGQKGNSNNECSDCDWCHWREALGVLASAVLLNPHLPPMTHITTPLFKTLFYEPLDIMWCCVVVYSRPARPKLNRTALLTGLLQSKQNRRQCAITRENATVRHQANA